MLMIGKELTPQQRLQKAVVDIMANANHVAIAPVLMIGGKRICPDTPTAYTDGLNEVYGEEFVNGLNDAELRFLVLHETYHKLYQHLTTWHDLYKKNARLANMACDYVINQKIVDEDKGAGFIKVIDGALLDKKFRDMSAAQVFNALKDQDQSGGEGSAGQSLDEHGWEDAQNMSDLRKKQLQRDLDSAVRQGSLLASKSGNGNSARNIEDLLQPQVDWREQLRDFVQTQCSGNDYSTWSRPNRRYLSTGHYLPSGVSETMGELVVAIDTSGSVGASELTAFLSEIASICEVAKPEKLRLIYWGCSVESEEVYEQDELADVVKATKPIGGGGTDVKCVANYIVKNNIKAQAVVVLTDGYLEGSWGTWSVPTLWGIVNNKTTTSPVGVTVHINI